MDLAFIYLYAKRVYGELIQRVQKSPLNSQNKKGAFSAGFLTYVLLAVGMVVFVRPWEGRQEEALGKGLVFGGVMYGMYSCTLFAVLDEWNASVAVGDTLWGAFLFGMAALVGNIVVHMT